ncbi:hypothetical protein [Pseudomonas karstica]|uniref:hypothetical protein n=1 Tax=Pseudomonas karstica TaxID=1055468 RepID=UPI0031B60559
MSDDQLPDPAHLRYIPVSIPDLYRLMELRDALVALKGPLANDPGWRASAHRLLFNADTDDRVLGKINQPLSGIA